MMNVMCESPSARTHGLGRRDLRGNLVKFIPFGTFAIMPLLSSLSVVLCSSLSVVGYTAIVTVN